MTDFKDAWGPKPITFVSTKDRKSLCLISSGATGDNLARLRQVDPETINRNVAWPLTFHKHNTDAERGNANKVVEVPSGAGMTVLLGFLQNAQPKKGLNK